LAKYLAAERFRDFRNPVLEWLIYHLQRKSVANFLIQKIPSAILVIVVVSMQSHVLISLNGVTLF
jgi:hypothetical protein